MISFWCRAELRAPNCSTRLGHVVGSLWMQSLAQILGGLFFPIFVFSDTGDTHHSVNRCGVLGPFMENFSLQSPHSGTPRLVSTFQWMQILGWVLGEFLTETSMSLSWLFHQPFGSTSPNAGLLQPAWGAYKFGWPSSALCYPCSAQQILVRRKWGHSGKNSSLKKEELIAHIQT